MKRYSVIIGLPDGSTVVKHFSLLAAALAYYHEAQSLGYSTTLTVPAEESEVA